MTSKTIKQKTIQSQLEVFRPCLICKVKMGLTLIGAHEVVGQGIKFISNRGIPMNQPVSFGYVGWYHFIRGFTAPS